MIFQLVCAKTNYGQNEKTFILNTHNQKSLRSYLTVESEVKRATAFMKIISSL
jgi:hypothetical protein